ncbi:hypothetical protein RIF29_08510 [Crotalaria pallida]|uniref:Pectate lyase n=1 Tax=Crotalaria pallida TaxID=3830 RepID=A0AAN9FQU9_CROPI
MATPLSFMSLFFLLLLPSFISSSPLQDPELVVLEVQKSINSSRRNLGSLSCVTGNPIDDCWRCDPNWEKNRKHLADCAIGFGKQAIGGRDGKIYVVTDPSDDPVSPKPGTLRHGAIQGEPLWIIFSRDMVIKLKEELMMNSFKTIDGREGLMQRMPRCRHGYFHVVNNDYTWWGSYAIGGSAAPTIISEGNRFFAPDNKTFKEVTKREHTPQRIWKNWNWRSSGDLMLNGAFFTPSGAGASSSYARASSLAAKPSYLISSITASAGSLNCKKGSLC